MAVALSNFNDADLVSLPLLNDAFAILSNPKVVPISSLKFFTNCSILSGLLSYLANNFISSM